jgi:large subunit ribosomal protein L6
MSRIGKKPIIVAEGVEISIQDSVIVVKGKNGELTVPFEPQYVSFSMEEGAVVVTRVDDSKTARSRHGLYRSLVANAIVGVTEGYIKKLEIRGVGYKAAVKGENLEMALGYSHPIIFPIPSDVTIELDKENQSIIIVSGINNQRVGQAAANIRSFRKPEPYKGKGIRYVDEFVIRKAGKSNTK